MTNLLSIPCLETDRYHIKYNNNGEWVVMTPKGVKIPFKRETGLCKGIPYIELRDYIALEVVAMIETVGGNF